MSTGSSEITPITQFNHDQIAFLRLMGHELRSPLNSILATAEMMMNGVYGELQPPQSKATQRVLRNSHRLLELINAVMTYIRAQANALERNSTLISIKDLLKERIVQHQAVASGKGLNIEMQIQPDTIETVQGDPDQIALIVDELLKNAVSYTTSGRILVQVGNGEPDHWVLTVADTGSGIEPDEVPLVFTPFWRGRAAKQNVPEGNGLGLAIVRELICLMSGRIHLESEVGKGTTLKLTLPNIIPANLETKTVNLVGSEDTGINEKGAPSAANGIR